MLPISSHDRLVLEKLADLLLTMGQDVAADAIFATLDAEPAAPADRSHLTVVSGTNLNAGVVTHAVDEVEAALADIGGITIANVTQAAPADSALGNGPD